jgi:hypothetical protein
MVVDGKVLNRACSGVDKAQLVSLSSAHPELGVRRIGRVASATSSRQATVKWHSPID